MPLYENNLIFIDTILDYVEDLEAWAKDQGCKKMELFARPGWEKVMKPKGYKKTHVQIEKELWV